MFKSLNEKRHGMCYVVGIGKSRQTNSVVTTSRSRTASIFSNHQSIRLEVWLRSMLFSHELGSWRYFWVDNSSEWEMREIISVSQPDV